MRTLVAAVLGVVAGAAVSLAVPLRDGARDRAPRVPRTPFAVAGRAPIPTLLAWTPGRLPSGYAGSVRGTQVVTRVATVRSGTAWLSAWSDRRGERRRPPSGYLIPVEAAAVAPDAYARFVPPAERTAFEALARGGALVSRSAASLRDIGEGSRLRFGDVAVRVEAVVDDELVGAHEVVVANPVGARLGISRPRYLLVEPRPGAGRRVVEERLRELLPSGVRLRIRGPGETPVFRHGDAVLPPLRLKELFGEFAAAPAEGGALRVDPSWEERHIRSGRVPVLGEVRCRRSVIPTIRSALREVVRRGLADRVDASDYGGCFSPRFANRDPEAGISHHSWGVALDLNVSQNPLGGEPRLDPRLVEIFERHGFTWGGRWLVPDGMHFEFLAPAFRG